MLPPANTSTSTSTTVYFDGSCPLCRREISVYRRAVPAAPIDWVDVSAADGADVGGARCGDLMARFHVRTAQGVMLSGAAAFIALWLLFPGWRWLGKFGMLPGMRPVLELAYRGFLRVRPRMQWLARKFDTAPR
ncbi:thiol-disulfide oxidoreductase DCC family protein [Massilia sp. DWR3-1-1]|uniref:thiol-disulfide oxidoreductase DCC family protein n=1 Tax=Massilia sp. DWR3-1-1 TaxID=2804559 RepID=UPI003CF67E73